MDRWSRRDVLIGGAAVPALSLLHLSPITQWATAQSQANEATQRERLLMDFGWRFHMGNACDSAKDFGFASGRSREFQKTGDFLPIAALAYDDTDWRDLDLPHDWAIELPFTNDSDLASKGFYPIGRSFPQNSVGWYRKVFMLPEGDKGKRVSIEFDGVYREALVVFNGFYIGQHRGGYDSFSFDLTDFINPGAPNVLLVRVDATMSDGWFYEGAGIYRHVWLVKTAPVHVKKWGTFVRSTLENGTAHLRIRTEIENDSDAPRRVQVRSTIVDPFGKQVGKVASRSVLVADCDGCTYEQQITIPNPSLWSMEERSLYNLVTEVEANGQISDRYETGFGIRTLKFDANRGFFLNGQPVKVKGTCNHQDHAGLGVALPDAAQYFRVRKLQSMGCNAYRTSHNPPSPELLEACDALGMLVLDETRMMSSNTEAMSQYEDLLRRDRNHPSVFMWSLGNEEHESTTEVGLRILSSMKHQTEKIDGSRPVTVAPPPLGLGLGQGGLKVSDVMGYNYADPQIEAFHEQHPSIPTMGTENVSAVATRGIYKIDTERGFVSSYDPYTTTGRASGEGWWRFADARPWLSGGFVWTGFDYRGEPSPYKWPNISSQYGVIDTCGFPKDTYYYFQSWWTEKPVLHVFPHWNWLGLEGKQIAVRVLTNLDRVELIHNGRSLGSKAVQKDTHLQWDVVYEPGAIEARGFKNEELVMASRRETTGKPAKLAIHADRKVLSADGEDLAFFTIEVQDSEGRIVPTTDNEITFRVTGPGRLKGVGNGDPTSHESDIGSTRKAFSGLCLAIVQVKKDAGQIQIEASSPGLASSTATIIATSVTLRPQLPPWIRPVPRGEGVTGLWRAIAATQEGGPEALQLNMHGDTVYTFIQHGASLTGTVEAPPPIFGAVTSGLIEEGRVDGTNISFRVGSTRYVGVVTGDRIEIQRSAPPRRAAQPATQVDTNPAIVIGPPPDGTDPSLAGLNRRMSLPPIILRRAIR